MRLRVNLFDRIKSLLQCFEVVRNANVVSFDYIDSEFNHRYIHCDSYYKINVVHLHEVRVLIDCSTCWNKHDPNTNANFDIRSG